MSCFNKTSMLKSLFSSAKETVEEQDEEDSEDSLDQFLHHESYVRSSEYRRKHPGGIRHSSTG